MDEKIKWIVLDEVEIDIPYLKEIIRNVHRINDDRVILIRAGVGVLTSREAKIFLERVQKKINQVKLVILTDSLPTKLQANFIRKTCLKKLKMRVVEGESSELNFWLN